MQPKFLNQQFDLNEQIYKEPISDQDRIELVQTLTNILDILDRYENTRGHKRVIILIR